MTVAFPQSAFVPAADAAQDAPVLMALHDRIADIARRVEAPFTAAGSMLMEVVEALDRIITQLDEVAKAIDRPAASASVTDLKRVADGLMALPETQAVRASRMNDVADAGKDLGINITAVGRTLRMMDIFRMNIGVASEGEPDFSGFVCDMSDKLADGERDLARLSLRLTRLSKSVARMRRAEHELATESAQMIPHVPRQLIRDATTLDDHLAASAIAAGQVAVTARRVRDQVAVMLGALQVGDRTRQRLEHVTSGLEMAATSRAGGTAPAAVGHLERLLVAQIEATAADFDADALLLADAFGALQPDMRELLELMEAPTGAGGAGALTDLKKGIGEVMRLIKRLRAADDRARTIHGLITGAIADLSLRLDGIRRLRGNVQVLATNIALTCHRHGRVGRGVSAIADQIDLQAAVLPQLTENIARPIGVLTTVNAAMQQERDGADAVDAVTVLSGAMKILNEGARRSQAASEHYHSVQGRRLIETIGSAAGRIARERSLATQVHDCAAVLSAQSPSIAEMDDEELAALTPVLQSLGALYTMAQEREIHARFLPPGLAAAPTEAAPEDDDDDGLF